MPRLAAVALAWLLGACVTVAQAGSFQITPLRVDLSASRSTATLAVKNQGDAPAVMHVRLFAWSQEGGRDTHTPTRDILATPPIFTIPAHGEQVVRIGLRRKPDPRRELSYRVFLEEVPDGANPAAGQGVRVMMRFSLPLFVDTSAKPVTAHDWRAVLTSVGEIRLRLDNHGNRHAKVGVLSVSRPSGESPLAKHEGLAYVLPGQRREWTLRPQASPQPGEILKIAAQSDEGSIDAEIRLEQE